MRVFVSVIFACAVCIWMWAKTKVKVSQLTENVVGANVSDVLKEFRAADEGRIVRDFL